MEYKVNPYKCITKELVDSLIIHHTVSALRRALERSPWIEFIEGTDKVPTLYYRKGSEDPNENDWTIHALCRDLHKFQLEKLITVCPDPDPDPDPDPKPDKLISSIEWNYPSGMTQGYPLVSMLDGGILIFDGYVSRDCFGNHTVSVIISVDPTQFIKYKDTIKLKYNNCEFKMTDPTMLVLVNFKIPGQEFPIQLIWDKENTHYFNVCLTQESVLL